MIAETQQVVTPHGPDDEPTHEASGKGGQKNGDDRAEIERSRVDGAARAPAESDHAAPDSRRHSSSPSSRAKAAIGNMTNAAVNNVTLSRMVSGSSRSACFARHVPDLMAARLRMEFSHLRPVTAACTRNVGEDLIGRTERKIAGRGRGRESACADGRDHRTLSSRGSSCAPRGVWATSPTLSPGAPI